MNVLVVGEGGREHALVWALSRSARIGSIHAAPGNAGIGELAQCVDINAEDGKALAEFAVERGIDLAVIGPDGALAAGVVDDLEAARIPAFGPNRAAARIEYSKAFAKALMQEEGIPTADYAEFTDLGEARAYIHDKGGPIVVKADGLAAGKGVVVCESVEEAIAAVDGMLVGNVFGDAGKRVIIEDFLEGEEASVFSITDGMTNRTFLSSQDHKQIFDGDSGPNTGGMGAYAPAPLIGQAMLADVVAKVVEPALRGLSAKGCPFKGVLYTGLMVGPQGYRVVEFNSRFGDPETQVLLPLLENDFLDLVSAVCDGKLSEISLKWRAQSATCVVLASQGYPGSYEKGKEISGLETLRGMEDVIAFHANTAARNGKIVTNGGRVLGITAVGSDLSQSIARAYEAIDMVDFEGKYHRGDIGFKGLPPT